MRHNFNLIYTAAAFYPLKGRKEEISALLIHPSASDIAQSSQVIMWERHSRQSLPGIPRACDRCDSSPNLWGFCHSD